MGLKPYKDGNYALSEPKGKMRNVSICKLEVATVVLIGKEYKEQLTKL